MLVEHLHSVACQRFEASSAAPFRHNTYNIPPACAKRYTVGLQLFTSSMPRDTIKFFHVSIQKRNYNKAPNFVLNAQTATAVSVRFPNL